MINNRIVLLFVVLIGACSMPVKETVIQEANQVDLEKTQLDGIWVGSFDIRGRGPFDFFAIHVGGRSTAVSYKAKAMCFGQVSQNEGYYYAKYNLYALDGSHFDYARLTGEIKDNQIQSHFTTLNGGDTGRLQLSYSDLYEQPSSLELLEGEWSFTDRDNLEFNFTIKDGVINGADSDDCKYLGNVSLINPQYNAYEVILNISNCASVNGEYHGLSYIDNKQAIYFRVDIGNDLYGFHYDFEKK
ncbi:MAG: hypothetical protein R8G33_00315 [Gammaproteobacteria bacterium]|nr:hypothetical protein [Gammaproteobacteria bacterium]